MVVDESILHVDMDAFYASVEAIKDPSLSGKPVIVGGQGGRGVVTSASYEARTYGIHSAMPMVRARRLCPHAVFLGNDFGAYQDYSSRIRTIFLSFTPFVEPLSLDEAFLDVSGSVRLFGPPEAIGRQIKEQVRSVGLTCTVGVAPNKFLAKMASAASKPDGLLVVPAAEVEQFLHPLPVRALWGVGEQSGEVLHRLGLKRVGDIARIGRGTLQRAVGDALGAHLHALARGIDDRPVTTDEPAKSVGSEETFAHDLDSEDDILREVLRLADRTAGRLRTRGICGRTITLKVRFSNFKTITRAHTLEAEVDATAEVYKVARELYLGLRVERPRIRLVGVSVSGLAPGPPKSQLNLLAGGGAWNEASKAVDRIRDRFGDRAVTHAALLDRPE